MNLNRFCYLLLTAAAIFSALAPAPLTVWLISINLLTLAIYGTDKLAARKAWLRVPELMLLVFGFVGGWIGAIFAQQIFRHKTQKQPFKTYFAISTVLNVIIVTAVIYRLYQQ
ncbi:DUF1294 domain-containing protein [Enterobacteriaceae bacterium 4M9]|nr:DUF1294 domain-containing protein [Enterobacteriaceae bacterium 4M9]